MMRCMAAWRHNLAGVVLQFRLNRLDVALFDG